MLEAYLADLERELAHRLPADDVRARLIEAETHLRDGIEGRIELGMRPEEAEREAILTFGPVAELARRASREFPAGRDRFRNRAQEATLALAIVLIVVGPVVPRVYLVAQGLAVVGVVVFGAASYRFGHPSPFATLRRSLAGVAVLAALCGVFWLRPEAFGGAGYGGRWDFRGERENYFARLPHLRRNEAIFARARTVLAKPGGVEDLRDSEGYLAPSAPPSPMLWQTLETTHVSTAEAARAAWRDFAARGSEAVNVAQTEAYLRGLERAETEQVPNFLACALPIVPIALVYALGFVALDLLCGYLGMATERIGLRWRGGVA